MTVRPRFCDSEYFAPALTALAAFCLYLFCLAPSIATGGDCGELVSASYNLGIAHPSGYALYCIAGKIFATILPFGEIAWRYNLFSAVCGAVTCGLIALIVSRLTTAQGAPNQNASNQNVSREVSPPFWPPLLAGLLLAGLTFFGSQALIAEVYAPNGLIVALAFLCLVNWDRNPEIKHLAALGAVLGLGLNLHLSILFLFPGIVVFLLWKFRDSSALRGSTRLSGSTPMRSRTPFKAGFAFAIFFLLGFAVTLYLPWRAATFPEPLKTQISGQQYSWGQTLDWGHPVDFPRWKAHVLVQQYKSLLLKPVSVALFGRSFQARTFVQSPQGALALLQQLLLFLALQFLWSTPLIFVGAVQSWRRRITLNRALPAFFAVTFLLNVFIAINYSVDNVFDIANFLFPAYLVLAIWLGLGIDWLLQTAAKQGENLDRKQKTPIWRWRFLTTAKLFLLGAVVLQWMFFAMTSSWRGNTRALDATLLRATAMEKLARESNGKPSLLMLSDDTLFPFWYAQTVLRKAETTRTPWGVAMHAFEDQQKLPELAGRLLKTGPVATTQWRADLDAKFPYAPLTKTGNLWQLTTGVLPPPAQTLKPRSNLKAGVAHGQFLQREIRRGELVGFQMDFVAPVFLYKRLPPNDRAHNSAQIGFAEVLVAPRELALRPTFQQTNISIGKKPLVWKQSRRLVIPSLLPLSGAGGQLLRATLPFEFPIGLKPGDYDVWARIVPLASGGESEWKKVDSMRLIVR